MKTATILIIEDNLELRENTAEILELAGYEVGLAENGKVGAKKALQLKPNLIICDIMMPELDGYGVLNILSRNPDTSLIPFIFLTAKSELTDIRKGMNLGADDYITKPFDETDLLEAIETRLKKSEQLQLKSAKANEGLNALIDASNKNNQLTDLTLNRKEQHYNKKTIIYNEGDPAKTLFYLIEGAIKCVKMDSYGKELVTELIGAGTFFGYQPLLTQTPYSETAVALENCNVSIIPKADFETLINQDRDVAMRFIKLLSGNIREKETQLLQMAYAPVRERVANVLLKVAKFSSAGEQVIDVSREDLANMVGTAKESLIRTLSDFKKEGWIEISGRTIRLSEVEKLQRLTNGF